MKFDAPCAEKRMARLKLSGECGVLMCFVKVSQRVGMGQERISMLRVKGK